LAPKTPEEAAGYTRFTVILPTDVVKKLDILKTFADFDNRNRVIQDAVEFLDHVASEYGFAGAQGHKTKDIQYAEENVQEYVTQILVKYWAPYAELYKKAK
jgi:metal-responsive CopG/Arc/MetJ family transcriptional regulator